MLVPFFSVYVNYQEVITPIMLHTFLPGNLKVSIIGKGSLLRGFTVPIYNIQGKN